MTDMSSSGKIHMTEKHASSLMESESFKLKSSSFSTFVKFDIQTDFHKDNRTRGSSSLEYQDLEPAVCDGI
jgi:hypothetical protein